MASVTVAGVPLASAAYRVASRTGWRSFPGTRNTSISASNTDGVLLPGRQAPLEPGALGLSLWVRGRDYAEFTAHVDTLMALFATQRGTVEVRLATDEWNGVERVCQARTASQWAVDHISPLHAQFQVIMEIPSGTWTSPDYYVTTREPYTFANGPIPLECGDPSAPPTDIKVLLADPLAIDHVGLWDGYDEDQLGNGDSATLDLVSPLPSTSSILVDLGEWRAYEIQRPTLAQATPEWFDGAYVVLNDLTVDLDRRGPMFGRAMLPLQLGSALPPRTPKLTVLASGAPGSPYANLPEVAVAIRPRWL